MTPGAPFLGLAPRRWQPEALEAVRDVFRAGWRRAVLQACTGSGKSFWLAEAAAQARGRVLVTTPTQALVEQLAGTLAARSPGEVGRCYQHAWEPDRRIVVTCLRSLPDLLREAPSWDLWLCDEAHRQAAGPDCRAVAVTATPFRGMGAWGPPHGPDRPAYVYSLADAEADRVLVPFRVDRYDGAHDHLPEDERADAAVRAWVPGTEGPGIITAQTVADAEAFAATVPSTAAIHCYLPRAERVARVEGLMAGRWRALVSVLLLSEGVDLPDLRWLALRVPVPSPVRLVQTVGRVLRVAEGKAAARVFDPHDCLGAVGLVHPAALGTLLTAAPEEPVEQWEIPELLGLGETWAALPAPVAVAAWEGWVADLRARLAAAWDLKPPARDRLGLATPQQRARLEHLQGREVGRLPEWSREAFRWLLAREDLRRGAAQDAIDALHAVADRRRAEGARGNWRWMVARSLVPPVPALALRSQHAA